jgi:FixJ family two-component response regulator
VSFAQTAFPPRLGPAGQRLRGHFSAEPPSIPERAAERTALRAPQPGSAITISEARVPKTRVISIVDDDPSVREGTMDLLNSLGFMAMAFERPGAFLQFNRIFSTSCLIADVQLPGMTGFELYEHLVGSGQTVPTILITAFPDDEDRTRALRAGVSCYLAKPFNAKELLACIQSALACRQRKANGA